MRVPEQRGAFDGPVLIVWARDEKLMPPEHAVRLAEHFDSDEMVWATTAAPTSPSTSPRSSPPTSKTS